MAVKNRYDVVVVGGGPSGSAAAIAAGRMGASVLLIEKENCLGGMSTAGFVNPLFDHANKGGLLREYIDELKSRNAWGGFWRESFVYEYMKELLERKCLEAGADLLYDTRYVGAEMDGSRITGVRTENIEGRKTYLGGVVIDASGDGAVAADAGAPWELGDENGQCQSMTLMYLIGGLPDKYRNEDGLMMYDVLEAAFARQNAGGHSPFARPYLIPIPNSDFAVLQLTHMRGYSPLDAAGRTMAVIEGRRQMIATFEALRDFDEDFKNAYLIQSAPLLGVRESRRILGEYLLTEEDCVSGARFEDAVADVTFGIDIHDSDSKKQTCRGVKPYQIPFRCLIPKNVEGLLVAGKTISGTHAAMASYRVTGNCVAMGEAAGKAAAWAALHNASVRKVPVEVYAIPTRLRTQENA